MKKSVWIGIQNKERSVTLHGSLLRCLLNHGNNPVSPPSPSRGSQWASVYFQSIEMWEAWPKLHPMNVNNCCRWPATAALTAALQHRLQAMWRFEEQSICLVSAHLHFCTNYALTMNTMHWLCICTLSTNTAALQHCRPGGAPPQVK